MPGKRLAFAILAALALAGCGGPDIEYNGTLNKIDVRARAYRITGPLFSVNIVLNPSVAAPVRVRILDSSIQGTDAVLYEATSPTSEIKRALISFSVELKPDTVLSVSYVGSRPGSPESGDSPVKFGAAESDLTSPVSLSILALIAGTVLRVAYRNLANKVKLVSDTTRPVSIAEGEVSSAEDEVSLRRKMSGALAKLTKECETLHGLSDDAARLRVQMDARIDQLANEVSAVKSQPAASAASVRPIPDVSFLDEWVRFVGAQGAAAMECWSHAQTLLNTANDVLEGSRPPSGVPTTGKSGLEWVRIGPTSIRGGVEVVKSEKPTQWLSYPLSICQMRLIVPATRNLDILDRIVLKKLFRGTDNIDAPRLSSMRVMRPSIVPLTFGAPSEERPKLRPLTDLQTGPTVIFQGRALLGNDFATQAEYITLALERSMIIAHTVARQEPVSPVVERALDVVAKVVAAGASGAAQPVELLVSAISPMPTLPDLWWNEPLTSALREWGTQPENYADRVRAAAEALSKALNVIDTSWRQKLARIRFDFDKGNFELIEVEEHEGAIRTALAGKQEVLQGRDLYQLVIIAYYKSRTDRLVFVPLGDFLLENHATVFSRLIEKVPYGPVFLSQLLRPATLEKVRGREFRLVKGGQMAVEVRIED